MARTSRDVSTHAEASRPTAEEPKRIPVASNRAPLQFKGVDQENFAPRWVMDKDDRIPMFLEAGYTFVNRGEQKIVGERTVDSKTLDTRVSKSSGGRQLFLMQLPKKFYDQDQAAKQRAVDELEKSMQRPVKNKDDGDNPDYGKIVMERSGEQPKSA